MNTRPTKDLTRFLEAALENVSRLIQDVDNALSENRTLQLELEKIRADYVSRKVSVQHLLEIVKDLK